MNKANNKKEYIKRIHTLQDYIDTNIGRYYTSNELTKVSGFSKYHFHRIFKSIQNESLFQYVTREKLELAASTLIARPDLSITAIAYQFGFSDSAVFSRAFKSSYGISPREFKRQYSNNCKDSLKKTIYTKSVDSSNNKVSGEVKVITIDSIPVIYKRKTGAYKDLYSYSWPIEELFDFAIRQNLIDKENFKILTVYHSHPDFSEEEKQRTSICLSIKEPFKCENAGIPALDSLPVEINMDDESEIGFMLIPSGAYAIAHFEIFQSEYAGAWKFLYGEWLPGSGYLPNACAPFEVYLNNPKEDPEHKHIVEIYLPVEPFF